MSGCPSYKKTQAKGPKFSLRLHPTQCPGAPSQPPSCIWCILYVSFPPQDILSRVLGHNNAPPSSLPDSCCCLPYTTLGPGPAFAGIPFKSPKEPGLRAQTHACPDLLVYSFFMTRLFFVSTQDTVWGSRTGAGGLESLPDPNLSTGTHSPGFQLPVDPAHRA